MHSDPALTPLRHALQALALPADRQLLLLPGFVPEVDELALAFDHALRAAEAVGVLLSPAQRAALREVETLLDRMSGQSNSHHWTRSALRVSERWSALREAAAGALRAFDWTLESPPGRLFEYIEW